MRDGQRARPDRLCDASSDAVIRRRRSGGDTSCRRSTSTTLVESRRKTLAVRSRRNGARTRDRVTITRPSRPRKAFPVQPIQHGGAPAIVSGDVRALLAHQPAHDARVPRQFSDVGRLHGDLPRARRSSRCGSRCATSRRSTAGISARPPSCTVSGFSAMRCTTRSSSRSATSRNSSARAASIAFSCARSTRSFKR